MHPPGNETELDQRASAPDPGVVETVSAISGDIVVAGAGGKMGYHLCQMLRRAIDECGASSRVWAVSRFGDPAARIPFREAGIETISCDLTDPGEYSRLPEAAAAFYLAGMKFGTSDSPETLRLFNEEMPARFARHYSATPLVALSTGCVYPFVRPETGGSKESDPVGPVGDYARSCLGRERAFEAACSEQGTPVALIRLNYSVDLRYGVLVDIAQQVRNGQPVDVTMGHLNCIWQGDATRHIVRALGLARAPEPFVLNVTGADILRVRDIAAWFGERFGVAPGVLGTEGGTAWLNDASLSHRLFGQPEVDESTLMEWVAAWIEQGNPHLGKPTHFEVRDGKF